MTEALAKKSIVYSPKILGPAVFLLSLGLYIFTSARYPGWVDAAWIMTSAKNLELGVWANVHNLFNLIGFICIKIFGFMDPYFSLTLLCSLLGSLTVLFTFLAGTELTANPPASALTSLAMTVSLSLWWHSTAIEVYTLNTVIIMLFFYFVIRAFRRDSRPALFTAYFLGGLGISNHVLMALYVIAFFAVLLPVAVRRFKLNIAHILGLIFCYIAGAAFYGLLFIIHWHQVFISLPAGIGSGTFSRMIESLGSTFQYAMGGPFLKSMFSKGMPASSKFFWRWNYLFLILLNFPSAAIVFIAVGFPKMFKSGIHRDITTFYLTGLIAQVIWSANYFIWDMYAFALPVYVMLSIPLVLGLDRFMKRNPQKVLVTLAALSFLISAALYPSFSHWSNREKTVDKYMSMYPEVERTGGIWDPAEYIFNPIKRNYTRAAEFSEGVLAVLPTGASYWDDESKGAYPLEYYYQDVKKRRLDVDINRIFGLIMSDEDALYYARRMLDQLRGGQRVFLSSLAEPEREILYQLYHILSPETPLSDIRSMSREKFCETLPGYSIIDIPLGNQDSTVIYELKTRKTVK